MEKLNKKTVAAILKDLDINEEELKSYNYLVLANDKFLSGWGGSGSCGHVQVVLCKSRAEQVAAKEKIAADKTFNFVRCDFLSYFGKKSLRSDKSYSFNLLENCPLWR